MFFVKSSTGLQNSRLSNGATFEEIIIMMLENASPFAS
jgi:deoxyribose-phosphate aldolase